MIGTSAQNLFYQSIEDVKSPAGYLDYMFGGMQGVAYRATINPKYHHTFYRAANISKAPFYDVPQCYVSMNTYWRSSGMHPTVGRDEAHVKRLNAFYVDIDCYSVGLSKEYVLGCLEHRFIGESIPVPTFIIDSGRGLYLIWKLQNEDCRALSRWRAVQEYLVHTLAELGADANCVDASRVLRVPGSINPKSNSRVSVLEFNDLVYTIYEIAREYDIKAPVKVKKQREKKKREGVVYPYNHATEKQRNYVRDLAKRLKLTEEDYPDFTSFQATDAWIKEHKAPERPKKDFCYKTEHGYSLPEFRSMRSILAGYCEDIWKLFSMRKGEDCRREIGLFMHRYFLREMKIDSEQALRKTLELNASLDCPLDEAEVIKATASADRRIEKGIPYAYKRSTIIQKLKITEEELKELPHFAARVQPSKEYRKAANRRAYESRLAAEGKVAKKDAVLQRRAEILALQEQGKTAEEIQESLQISKATYYRDIAALGTESVLEAARTILQEKAAQIIETVEKAAEVISDAIKSVQESDIVAAIRAARLSKKPKQGQSQIFSIPFRERRAIALLPVSLPGIDNLIDSQFTIFRAGDRGSGDDPDGASPLPCLKV